MTDPYEQLRLARSKWTETRNPEEWTNLSEKAIEWAERCAQAILGKKETWFKVQEGSALLILARGALHVIVGQPSATAHGKQGLSPKRVAALRELGIPARIVFWEGGKWKAVWLGINEPRVVRIQREDKTRLREGWKAADLIQAEGQLYFPLPEEIQEDAAKQQGAPPNLFDEAA